MDHFITANPAHPAATPRAATVRPAYNVNIASFN
jgi:hypothetical protein